MSGRPPEIEQAMIEDGHARALAEDLAETNFRAFEREAAIACLALVLIGGAALAACMAANFEVGVATSRHAQITGMEGQYGVYGTDRNVTPLVMGLATAAFAAAMIVAGGALPQWRRLSLPTLYMVGGGGLAALAGLIVMALVV